MKAIILNLFLLLLMLLIITFLAMFFTVVLPWYSYVLLSIDIGLLIYYPVRLNLIEIRDDYRYYRKNSPVKILEYIKLNQL